MQNLGNVQKLKGQKSNVNSSTLYKTYKSAAILQKSI